MTWFGVRDPVRRAHLAAGAARPPLPLDQAEAIEQALLLRSRGMQYAAITVVMGLYHGQWATVDAWRDRLRRNGAAPRLRGAGNGATALRGRP